MMEEHGRAPSHVVFKCTTTVCVVSAHRRDVLHMTAAKAWGDGTYGELGGVEELSWLVP